MIVQERRSGGCTPHCRARCQTTHWHTCLLSTAPWTLCACSLMPGMAWCSLRLQSLPLPHSRASPALTSAARCAVLHHIRSAQHQLLYSRRSIAFVHGTSSALQHNHIQDCAGWLHGKCLMAAVCGLQALALSPTDPLQPERNSKRPRMAP